MDNFFFRVISDKFNKDYEKCLIEKSFNCDENIINTRTRSFYRKIRFIFIFISAYINLFFFLQTLFYRV